MKVILPGSYDPITNGHLEVIRQASEKFDAVYVVAFINPKKKYRFSLNERVSMLMLATEDLDNVLVSYSDGLVIDYMRDHEIDKIVKGYRTDADLPWEHEQAEWNLKHGGVETELWKCKEELENISSTAVRAALDEGASISHLVPEKVSEYIKNIREATKHSDSLSSKKNQC
jgi:pantetheine-phosphate adenylyltransferase